MNIAIIGPGAMGSLFGALLSQVADVVLIHYREEYVETLNKNGVIVEKPDGSMAAYKIPAVANYRHCPRKAELAIVFTKSHKTEQAAETARSVLTEDGLGLTLQNGLGNWEIMEDVLGKGNAVAGVTSHGGTLLAPGRVRHAGLGPTHIARGCANEPLLERVRDTFNAAGIETSFADNMESLIWGKLLVNVGINALAAILRVPNGVLGTNPACETLVAEAVSEAAAVARALKIKLPYDDPLTRVKQVCEATGQNRASMLQDILKNSRTEIGAINKAIEAKGRALEIPTPVNRILAGIIEAMESTAEERISDTG